MKVDIEVVMVMTVAEAAVLRDHLGKEGVGHATDPHYYALDAQLDRLRMGAAN